LTRRRIILKLGLTPAEAELLTRRAATRLGRRSYEIRALAFTVATTERLRPLIPRRLRLKAIRPLLHALFPGPSENLLYAVDRMPAENGGGNA
jgi:hypothetical protein